MWCNRGVTREQIRLIVDTDTASDDAVALLLACTAEHVSLEAVTVVAGNVPLAQAVRNALFTMELCGRTDVPVYAGCDRPMQRILETAQDVHGADGMGDVGLPMPVHVTSEGHAVNELVRRINADPGQFTLVTLGPLTNIAAALQLDPDLLRKCKRVVSMACSPDGYGNVSDCAEFNVWADPDAAKIAFSSGDDLTIVGWNISRNDAVMRAEDDVALRAVGTLWSDFVHEINRAVYRYCVEISGFDGYDLPDPIAMACALWPEIIVRAELLPLRIAVGDEARGASMVDHRLGVPGARSTIVWKADEAAFKQRLFEACAKGPKGSLADYRP